MDKATSLGMAAHITAAAPGGARYDPALTPEQRRDSENGIWLCQNHGKLVDDDDVRFPVTLLQQWKQRAEELAREAQGRPLAPAGVGMSLSWGTGISSAVDALKIEVEATVRGSERGRLETLLASAREHLERGQFELAHKEYAALRIDPVAKGMPELYFKIQNNLALATRALGLRKEAIEYAEAVRAANPENDVARLTYLGTLAAFEVPGWKDRFELERKWLETTSVGLQFLSTKSLDERQFEVAVQYAERAIELDPTNHAARFNKALALSKQDQIAEAIRCLDGIPADSTVAVAARVHKAELLYRQAQRSVEPEAGLAAAREALRLAEEIATAKSLTPSDWSESFLHWITCKAGIETVTGNPGEAIALLKRIDGAVAFPAPHHNNKAQAYAALGDWDAAIAELQAALEIEPGNVDYRMWLAATHVARFSELRNPGDLGTAERLLRQLLADSPTGLAVVNLAEIFVKTGRVDDANSLVERASQQLPNDPEVQVARLLVLRRTGHLVEATEVARRIHANNRTEPISATWLGVDAFRAGDHLGAIKYFDDALADPFCRSTDLLDAIVFRARALKRADRIADALEFVSSPRARTYLGKDVSRLLEELAGKE